jgi:hypothetical protein
LTSAIRNSTKRRGAAPQALRRDSQRQCLARDVRLYACRVNVAEETGITPSHPIEVLRDAYGLHE